MHEFNYDILEFTKLKENLLNKKRKGKDYKRRHTKFAIDNIRRKIKRYILNYALDFINDKIKAKYNEKIGVGISKKQLLPINHIIKTNMSKQFNKVCII